MDHPCPVKTPHMFHPGSIVFMGRRISQPGTGETRACKAVPLDQGSQQLKEIGAAQRSRWGEKPGYGKCAVLETRFYSGWWFGTMEFYDFPFSWE